MQRQYLAWIGVVVALTVTPRRAPAWQATEANASPPASHVYRTLGERQLQLAVHYPADWQAKDKRPVVLFFSGGHKVQPDANGKLPPLAAERAKLGLPAVNRGPGETHVPFCDGFAKRGLVCLRVEYRTRGKDGVLPGADIEDAICAVRWVKRHAHLLGADPARVVAAGGSSGGYLAASTFAFEDRYPDTETPPVSSRPSAVLLYSPLLDWLEAGSMTDSFLIVLGGDKELGAKVSPARHWRKDCPPTLVLEGSNEPPFAAVKSFAEKWQSVGAPVELYLAEGGEHGFFAKPQWLDKTNARTDEFLGKLGLLNRSVVAATPADEPTKPAIAAQPAPPAGEAKGKDASVEERLAGMLKRSPEADANKDGVLTMQEAQAFRAKSKKPKNSPPAAVEKTPAAAPSPAPAKPGAAGIVPGQAPSKSWDANGDGKIAKGEFKAPAQLFTNMDLDGDGFLAGDELKKLDQKLSLAKIDEAVWSVPPTQQFPGVEHRTYFSQAMRCDVGYNVFLPEGYGKSTERYPAIYHLHGSGGNESSQVDVSAVYRQAIAVGKICPVILVFVNGGKRSYYCDGANGKIMAETTIVRELIPHVDATLRTIPVKSCRAIHGFSMGGYGAMKLGMKFPELFCAVLSFGGGMASPESVHLDFLRQIVGSDPGQLAANNPADLAEKNKASLDGLSIWLFTGSRDVAREDSVWAHERLQTLGVPHRFEVSPDVGHTVKKHYELFGDEIFKMLQTHFDAGKSKTKGGEQEN